jgi:hypothetical protein
MDIAMISEKTMGKEKYRSDKITHISIEALNQFPKRLIK